MDWMKKEDQTKIETKTPKEMLTNKMENINKRRRTKEI
jgi:hypothetical protein